MRVRVRASGLARLVVLCGLIAELALGPGATSGTAAASTPRRVAPAVRPAAPRPRTTPLTSVHDAGSRARALAAYGALPLSFEENRGQTDGRVAFLSHGPGYVLYLTAGEAVLDLALPQGHQAARALLHTLPVSGTASVTGVAPVSAATTVSGTVLRLRLLGAAGSPRIEGQQPLAATASYLIGAAPAGWRTAIPTYARVVSHAVYPGIDLTYYGTRGSLEDDYTVAPGADPTAIRLAITGARALALDATGALVLDVGSGRLTQPQPVAYQDSAGVRQPVDVRYTLDGSGVVGFALGAYDHGQPLVIDPVLTYSSYLGRGNNDEAFGVAVDTQGAAYLTGETNALDFPTTTGAYSRTLAGGYDAFVTKLTPQGNALVYSTFIGGSGDDYPYGGLAVDRMGAASIAGQTSSPNFPVPNGAQTTHRSGQFNAFVATLDPTGTTLRYGTYLGGSTSDGALGVAADNAGNVYVDGQTQSANFPTTSNAFQTTLAGTSCGMPFPCADGFVTRLDTTKSGAASLIYSTYLGGTGLENANGIATDGAGDAYVTGYTSSTNFPTKNAQQGATGGGQDAFVSVLNTGASGAASLVYSSYLGGSGTESARGIARDGAGDLLVAGSTSSTNFPTANALQGTNGGGNVDAFVTKLVPSGSGYTLGYSTYLGGSGDDSANGLAVDAQGNAAVTGYTTSPNFPTKNAAQPVTTNSQSSYHDAFVTKVTASGGLAWSTYLGGSNEDFGRAIAVDGAGSAYVAGYTASSDFPTASALQGANNGGNADAFVTKLGATGGDVPWHPHQRVNVGGAFDVAIDLADGHADITTHDLTVPGRGLDLRVARTWDSVLAQAGSATAAGQGVQSSLTPQLSGALTGTVVYTDASGALWPFVYTGSLTAPPPYTSYQGPAGEPWQLATGTTGYTLTNFLTSAVMTFDASGRLLADTDSYGNTNTLSYGAGSARSPSAEANSGGRSLALGYSGGLLTEAQSPLWQSGGATTAASQHVTYGYNGSGQLTGVTRGAGTPDALAATLGYSGTQVVTLTTPANRVWTLGYDTEGRVTSLTSAVSGTVGQAGYTPAYTTQMTYSGGQTQVVVGVGTSGALTTTYTLDGQGEPITTTDGLGHSSSASYDADHNVLTSTDANSNTTTNKYQYIGPNGYSGPLGPAAPIGQIVEEDQPAIQPYVPGNSPVTPVITHTYDATTHALVATGLPEGGLTLYSYDGHHGVATTSMQTTGHNCALACPTTWQGALTLRDGYGEITGTVDGRGVDVSASGVATLDPTTGPRYTSHQGYNTQGDLTSSSTPPITTTLNGVTTTASAVTTNYTYDGDGNRQTMVSANGNTTTYGYDHLARPVTTTLPLITLYNNTATQPVETTGYDAEGNVTRATDANGHSTTSSYDPEGRQVSMTNPVSGTTLMTYTASELTAQQDPQGNVTGYGYDAAGRQIQMTDPATGTEQTAYDATGNTLAMTTTDRTAGNAAVTLETMGYDAQDRVITSTVVTNTANVAGSALTTLTAYDQDGNVAQTQQPNKDVVYNLYDAADRLTNVEIDPSPLTKARATTHPSYEAYGYDAAGNQSVAVDADNRLTTSQYDGDNRAVQSVAASTAPTGTTTITTTSQYDPNGNSVAQTTQTSDSTSPGVVQTHAITSAYNAADWETATSDDGYTTSYGYDTTRHHHVGEQNIRNTGSKPYFRYALPEQAMDGACNCGW